MKIYSGFDSGNIEILDCSNPADIRLAIRQDHHSDFYQWFYCRVVGARHTPLTLRITNAAGAAYPGGWDGYQAVASDDDFNWIRQPTRYDNGELIISLTPATDSVDLAYFAPYTLERHEQLVRQSLAHPQVQLLVPGDTLQGRPLQVLRAGNPQAGKLIWITARQHPGESMAAWLMEGLLEELLDEDSDSASLLQDCCFYLVPNMNPDGSTLGHLRTNAAGVNLNREWLTPSPERSPEVFYIRRLMQQTGCDLYLDIHGDETIPYNFIAGQEGLSENPEVLRQEALFRQWLLECSDDFQVGEGYAPAQFGEESFTLASNWVGREFNIPAMTLEMPFKDHNDNPDELFGWSPQRSMLLGMDLLSAIHRWHDQ